MTQTYYTLLTEIGAAEWVNAEVGGVDVPVTHLAIGDGLGNPVIPAETMTGLVNEVHRVPITSITADINNPNWLIFEAVILAAVGGWTIREIGLIGGNGVGNKLLAIGNFPATYKPVLIEGAAKDLVIRLIVQVSNASVVNLTIDPSVVVATNQAIANAVAAHEAKIDPHPVYLTKAEADAFYDSLGIAAAGVATHLSNEDPHPQYITQSELDAVLIDGRARRLYFANI